MRRNLATLLGAGLWALLPAPDGLAENLDPADFRVVSGALDCCEETGPCGEISRELEALYETDGECLKVSFGDPVMVELEFQTTGGPAPFLLRIAPGDVWQSVVAVQNWQSGLFDEVPVVPVAGEGSSLSGILPADYVDPGSGAIVVRIKSVVSPGVRDEKTLDEVEIVIPPPD